MKKLPTIRYGLSKRKLLFAFYYFDLDRRYSTCLGGNAYRSALKAGYSDNYSKKILSQMNWVELAWRVENQGYIVLGESERAYVQKIITKKFEKC